MNLFHLSLLTGIVALVLRVGFLLGRWSLLQSWFWRDFLDASLVSSTFSPDAEPLTRGAVLRTFVRERLEVWRASLLWGHCPVLSWRERAAIVRVQCCLLLVTLGWRLPLIVLGLHNLPWPPRSDWFCHLEQRSTIRLAHSLGPLMSWPACLEQRWSRSLHQRLTMLAGNETVLKRVTLARLYPTAEDIPTDVAQHTETVQ